MDWPRTIFPIISTFISQLVRFVLLLNFCYVFLAASPRLTMVSVPLPLLLPNYGTHSRRLSGKPHRLTHLNQCSRHIFLNIRLCNVLNHFHPALVMLLIGSKILNILLSAKCWQPLHSRDMLWYFFSLCWAQCYM